MSLTDAQLDLMAHALGAERGYYRNYFAAEPNTDDHRAWEELARNGFAACHGDRPQIFGSLISYSVTEKGQVEVRRYILAKKHEAERADKRTRAQRRYAAYLESETSESFGDWLKNTYWNDFRKRRHA